MRPKFAVVVAAIVMIAALFFAATTGYFEPDTTNYAVIDDVTRMKHIGSPYCLVSVDDQPVKRRRGRFIAMVPVALIPPGDRTLRLQLDPDDPESQVIINAKLEQGQRYRLTLNGEYPRLVQD